MKLDLRVIATLCRQGIRLYSLLVASAFTAFLWLVPLLLMRDLQGLRYWRAVGYFGIYMLGAAAVFRAFCPPAGRD